MAPAVKGTARYNRKLKMNRERKFKKQLHKVRKNKIGKVLRRELLHNHATDKLGQHVPRPRQKPIVSVVLVVVSIVKYHLILLCYVQHDP